MSETQKTRLNRREFLKLMSAAGGVTLLSISGGISNQLGVGPALRPAKAQAARQLVVSLTNTGLDEALTAGQAAVAQAYNALNPNVEIIFEAPPASDPERYGTWLGTQLAAATAGDVRPDLVSGVYAPSGLYVDLDRYATSINPYTNNPWNVDLDFDFYKWATPTGQRYCLSARSARVFWYYNRDIFEEVGIDTSPEKWARPTYQYLAEVCAQLEAAGYTPIGINFRWQANQWHIASGFDQYYVQDMVELTRAQPGDWNFNPDLDGNFTPDYADENIHTKYTYNAQRFFKAVRDGELRYDTPQLAEIVRTWSTVWPRYATEDMFVLGDPYPYFLQQSVAMMPSGSWQLPTITRGLESLTPERLEALELPENTRVSSFNWGTFSLPAMSGDMVMTTAKGIEGGTTEYLSIIDKDPDQVDAAVDFARFWLSSAGYQIYVDAMNGFPSVQVSGPPKVRNIVDVQGYAEFWEQAPVSRGNAEINANVFLYFGEQGAPGQSPFARDATEMLKQALELNLSPEDFAARFQQMFTDNFDAILERVGLTSADVDNPQRQPGT